MATPASPTYHRVVNAGSSSRPASTAAGLGSSLNASPSLYTYALSSPRVGHSNPGSISRNAPSPINGRSSATPTPGGRQQRRHQRNDSSNGSSLPANGGMSLHQHHHHHHPLGSAEWSWFGFDVPLTSLTSLRDALEGGSQGGEMGGGEADLGTSSNSRLHDGNSGGGEDNEIFGYDFGGGRWRVEMRELRPCSLLPILVSTFYSAHPLVSIIPDSQADRRAGSQAAYTLPGLFDPRY